MDGIIEMIRIENKGKHWDYNYNNDISCIKVLMEIGIGHLLTTS